MNFPTETKSKFSRSSISGAKIMCFITKLIRPAAQYFFLFSNLLIYLSLSLQIQLMRLTQQGSLRVSVLHCMYPFILITHWSDMAWLDLIPHVLNDWDACCWTIIKIFPPQKHFIQLLTSSERKLKQQDIYQGFRFLSLLRFQTMLPSLVFRWHEYTMYQISDLSL